MTVSESVAPAKADHFTAARALIKDLESRFPVFKDAAPLAIGIDKQVITALPEIEKKILRMALRSHTQSTRYLKSMEKGTQRLNLDGTAADEVTDEQRTHASDLLRERFKKKAEQKREAEAAAKAEARRQDKLNQLTERFGRKQR